jgi:superfamily II DNA or RNA helicase
VRAADAEENLDRIVQVASIQTENSRSIKSARRELHNAKLVVIDEAHLQTGHVAQRIILEHYEQGASIVGLTATPLGIGDIYTCLVVAGTNSELRACGALFPAFHCGPDEPDLRKLKAVVGEDLTEKQNRQVMMTPTIWGRVLTWFRKLTPTMRPSILFAPGVRESIFFAEEFTKAGIPAAHIDGQEVWINARLYRSSPESRAEVLVHCHTLIDG